MEENKFWFPQEVQGQACSQITGTRLWLPAPLSSCCPGPQHCPSLTRDQVCRERPPSPGDRQTDLWRDGSARCVVWINRVSPDSQRPCSGGRSRCLGTSCQPGAAGPGRTAESHGSRAPAHNPSARSEPVMGQAVAAPLCCPQRDCCPLPQSCPLSNPTPNPCP